LFNFLEDISNGISNGTNKSLLVISNESFFNETNDSNNNELNTSDVKKRNVDESYIENNSSLDEINDDHSSCGLQDQLILDSENTLNDFASSSSISVSSLSPLSDVNNNSTW